MIVDNLHRTIYYATLRTWIANILGYRLRNFEIRVGNDSELMNTGVWHRQVASVNKSDNNANGHHHVLQLVEVRVFGGEYNINLEEDMIIGIMVCCSILWNIIS